MFEFSANYQIRWPKMMHQCSLKKVSEKEELYRKNHYTKRRCYYGRIRMCAQKMWEFININNVIIAFRKFKL